MLNTLNSAYFKTKKTAVSTSNYEETTASYQRDTQVTPSKSASHNKVHTYCFVEVKQGLVEWEWELIHGIQKEIFLKMDDNRFSVVELADFAAMSERTLRRFIKKATGLSPIQLITEIRLQRAFELLTRREYDSVKRVAKKVGFGKSGNFASIFEKRFGKKPSKCAE